MHRTVNNVRPTLYVVRVTSTSSKLDQVKVTENQLSHHASLQDRGQSIHHYHNEFIKTATAFDVYSSTSAI